MVGLTGFEPATSSTPKTCGSKSKKINNTDKYIDIIKKNQIFSVPSICSKLRIFLNLAHVACYSFATEEFPNIDEFEKKGGHK